MFRLLRSVKMNKMPLLFAMVLATFSCAAEPMSAQVKLDYLSRQRTICDFSFAAVKDLVVVAKPISVDSLRTRVDNERYNACPYNVELRYKGISMRLDFGTDITLERVRNSAEDGFVRTAFFLQNENGWGAVGDDTEIEPDGIAVHENKDVLALSAVLRRKNKGAEKQDFCFSVDVIAEKKYVSGAVCRPEKSELQPIDKLFREKPVILFAN
jgi:hypothetical protein